MLGLEQDGPESCQRAVNSSFVMITVPVRVVGDGDKAEVSYHWRVGSFAGRDTPLTLEKGYEDQSLCSPPRGALSDGRAAGSGSERSRGCSSFGALEPAI